VISLHDFIFLILPGCGGTGGGPSLVELIQGSSWDVVLSDLWTGAREPAGILFLALEGLQGDDRAGLGALRPKPLWIEAKLFTTAQSAAAKLFTIGAEDEEGSWPAFLRRL
jgi:hypothetical protein